MESETLAKLDVAQSLGIVETNESFDTLLTQTRLLSTNAIPIPHTIGDYFAEKYADCVKVYKPYHQDWEKALKAYNELGSIKDYEEGNTANENFVRIITQSLLDLTYMQNPTAEFTTEDADEKPFEEALSAIITTIVNKASGIGLNIRPTILRQIAFGHLTNFGIIKLCYTAKSGSKEDTLKLFTKAQEKLKIETDPDKVNHLYSLLDILYKEMHSRQPFGLAVKNISPFAFMADVDTTKDDLSDAKVTFEIDALDEGHIKANYMQYDEDTQKWVFKYDTKTSYEDKEKSSGQLENKTKEAIIDQLMPDLNDNERQVMAKGKINCVWVHDRTTRYVYLYILNRWETPLWVFEDEMQLSRFFPYYLLAFSASMKGLPRLSEPSFYIPFQNEVNATNKQYSMVRWAAFSTIIYDTETIDKSEVDKVLDEIHKPTRRMRSIGVKLRDSEKGLSGAMEPFKLPVANMEGLFQDPRHRNAIDKASRLSEADRGGQYKTTTTNAAIAQYEEISNARIGTLTDRIEESMAQLFWSIAEIVVSKYDKATITTLVSNQHAENFQNMPVDEFNNMFALEIEGGSTEKANSPNKKKEAVQIIQMLGQFGTAAPRTVLGIVTKLLRQVFSRKLVTDKDLQVLEEEGQAAMQKGISTTTDPNQPQPQPQPQQPSQGM